MGRRACRSLWEGVIVTAADVDLRLIFLMGFMGFFAYGAFDSLESLFYRDVLCVGAEWMGWLSAIAGIGGTLGSYLIMRVPSGCIRLELLAAMLLVTGVGSVVYVGTAHVAVAAVGQLVCGIGFGAMGPVRVTLTQRLSDPAKVGRVLGVMRVGLNGAGVLPLIVAPFLGRCLWRAGSTCWRKPGNGRYRLHVLGNRPASGLDSRCPTCFAE